MNITSSWSWFHEEKSSLSVLSSSGYKLVPWLNWKEWEGVRVSLFSESPEKIALTCQRVDTWRIRGCLPDLIDATAKIIEIQQKDPFFRKDLTIAVDSEQNLAMQYSMAMIKLVNSVDKTRERARDKTKRDVSIAEAAAAIGMPRMLVDIRHESSHRDLPSLPLLRDSAVKAIQWLKSYYWEPQKLQVPSHRDGTANIRKEIKSMLKELASCLKVKRCSQSHSTSKGNCSKHHELFYGNTKFFSLMTRKIQSPKSTGAKKHIVKKLKVLVRLYSSFSSELLSVLLNALLKAVANSEEFPRDCPLHQDVDSLLNDWRRVLTKLSNKEPDILLALLKEVLNMIEAEDTRIYEIGVHLTSSEYKTMSFQIEQLSALFVWLVRLFKGLKPIRQKDFGETNISSKCFNITNASLMDVVRKCLLVSCINQQLMESVLQLVPLLGNSHLTEKLKRLSSLDLSESNVSQENSMTRSDHPLSEESIHEANQKLELVKCSGRKNKPLKTIDNDIRSSGKWVVAKSWKPCPIGMLPGDTGASGHLPILDCFKAEKEYADLFEGKPIWLLKKCDNSTQHYLDANKASGKREASSDISLLDASIVKKMKGTADIFGSRHDSSSKKGVEGCLIIDGAWKTVTEEELNAIKSSIKLLV